MKHYGDITKISGCHVPPVNVVIGGSPCQDLSVAGKRALSGGIYQVLQDNGRRLFDIVPVEESAKEEKGGGEKHDS